MTDLKLIWEVILHCEIAHVHTIDKYLRFTEFTVFDDTNNHIFGVRNESVRNPSVASYSYSLVHSLNALPTAYVCIEERHTGEKKG